MWNCFEKLKVENQVSEIRIGSSKKMYDEEEKRINFGRTFNSFLLTFHAITLCFVITWNINENQNELLAKSALILSDFKWLLAQTLVLILG